MTQIHTLGFPRIGAKRELKFALESYWKSETSAIELKTLAKTLRLRHWENQKDLDLVPIGDFSFYDQVLDMSQTLGNLPVRVTQQQGDELDAFFRAARGRSPKDSGEAGVAAAEMVKWFNSNYHYMVPEFTRGTVFSLNDNRLLGEIAEAKAAQVRFKPVLIGPVTYLWLGKEKDGSNRLDLIDKLLPVYETLLERLADAGAEWVQLDEPALTTTLDDKWREAFRGAYKYLAQTRPKLLIATYFSDLGANLPLLNQLAVDGVHLDAVNAETEIAALVDNLPETKVLSLGVIDGRNIWKSDLEKLLNLLEPIAERLGERLWLSASSSLLHVPVDLDQENELDPEIKSWLAFAIQKIEELRVLKVALEQGRQAVAAELAENAQALHNRRNSLRVNDPKVRARVNAVTPEMAERAAAYPQRAKAQKAHLKLPLFPTTTIGSFPQTQEIRTCRSEFRKGLISKDVYVKTIQADIRNCVEIQEQLGLDVLVHGEAERNDMVEYFGERLSGCVFTRFAWVQSYGSRCVKPPIIYGDISRTEPMTVAWSTYAQEQTDRPMKAMLTGPVTILNWSFVRDDQARAETCLQIALAIRDEVLDLEKSGLKIIQIDEPAIREGLPLKRAQWPHYLDWAVRAFRIAAAGVDNATQIHTHMCYSEFNDIIASIAALDADVITIETSRSAMKLLEGFETFNYPNEIGPGVYDIHSPNVPSVAHMVELIEKAAERIPAERLWVNPDCGLKTRQWKETRRSLANMVQAAETLRGKYAA